MYICMCMCFRVCACVCVRVCVRTRVCVFIKSSIIFSFVNQSIYLTNYWSDN